MMNVYLIRLSITHPKKQYHIQINKYALQLAGKNEVTHFIRSWKINKGIGINYVEGWCSSGMILLNIFKVIMYIYILLDINLSSEQMQLYSPFLEYKMLIGNVC